MAENRTQTRPTATPRPAAGALVALNRDGLLQALIKRALERDGRGDVMIVEYETDMTQSSSVSKPKLRAAFPNGLRHIVRTTVQVNYDYARKVENRTDGAETAKGGPTWQRAVVIDGCMTPLTVHNKDVATDEPLTFIPNARAYLRYEPLTDAQREGGFGKGDFSRYETVNADGEWVEVAYADVQPIFYDRAETAVNHRTLSLKNVTAMRFGGIDYQIRD